MNRLIQTSDGSHSLISGQFGVSYHSIHGAIEESKVVFIDAGLGFKKQVNRKLKVLEIGFGTGLNTILAYQFALSNQVEIEYSTFEAYPIDLKTAQQLNYPDLLKFDNCKDILLKFHSHPKVDLELFKFKKYVQHFDQIDFRNQFDVIFFDAFAPSAQPKLWEVEMLQRMYNSLLPEGVLTTYCAQGAFKRTLKRIGFLIEALPGPKGKREITRAIKQPV